MIGKLTFWTSSIVLLSLLFSCADDSKTIENALKKYRSISISMGLNLDNFEDSIQLAKNRKSQLETQNKQALAFYAIVEKPYALYADSLFSTYQIYYKELQEVDKKQKELRKKWEYVEGEVEIGLKKFQEDQDVEACLDILDKSTVKTTEFRNLVDSIQKERTQVWQKLFRTQNIYNVNLESLRTFYQTRHKNAK